MAFRLRYKCSFCLLFFYLFGVPVLQAQKAISIPGKASPIRQYAAKELQRYLYQLSGEWLPITQQSTKEGFVVNAVDETKTKLTATASDSIGDQGYTLKKIGSQLHITANTAIGCLYGVYGLLDDHYDVGFYFSGDILPQQKKKLVLPDVNEHRSPSMYIRGILPWTNFPQSATAYSWADWRYVIDQAARMRMNFIQVHNYNGQNGHNEPFHNFEVDGKLSRVWMPTAKTGHGWAMKGMKANDYRFGGEDLVSDYDMGSEVGLHNETLDNATVFAKGVNLMQRVIEYAHQRGVKIGLGLDIDLIMPEYGLAPDDPKVIKARMQQVLRDYPKLDYLILFISEMINEQPEKLQQWRRIFDGMYAQIKQANGPRIAVAGWGLSAAIANSLPPDVIAAPISSYSDGFEPGAIYGEREYWGCPWMERDFFSSEYYYPYNMHLQNTVQAWQQRSPNMKGLYTLSWRLTDAVDPKISFIAKAPWDVQQKLSSAQTVYEEYARRNYGAPDVASILNEGEALSVRTAECEPTASFSGKPFWQTEYLTNMLAFQFVGQQQRSSLLGYQNRSAYHNMGIDQAHSRRADSCFGWIQEGSWVRYAAVDFSKRFDSIEYATATPNTDVYVEVRLDSVSGKLVAQLPLKQTGGWHNWKDQQQAMKKVEGVHDVYFIVRTGYDTSVDPVAKANGQIGWLDSLIATRKDKGQVYRIRMVQERLAAARDHLILNETMPAYTKASELPGAFPSWVRHFTHRITDISSLGNVQSIQNRYVQENYGAKEAAFLQAATVKFPTRVVAKGTTTGAVVNWENNEAGVKGFYVYTDGHKLSGLLPPATRSWNVSGNGVMDFQVTALSAAGVESELSPKATATVGVADKTGPQVVVVSPLTSLKEGEPFEVTAYLLDNRSYALLKATLHYRTPGSSLWQQLPMQRRTKAIFAVRLPTENKSALEYFVSATDGSNQSLFPATAPNLAYTTVIEPVTANSGKPLLTLQVSGKELKWKASNDSNICFFKIYRSAQVQFTPSAATYVCYLPPTARKFVPNGMDFNGQPLRGRYYYQLTAVDKKGREVPSVQAVLLH